MATEETDNKPKSIPEEKTSGNLLNPKEEQMLIELPGVSISSIPRKDGRFQGYRTLSDGKKKYYYGRAYKDVFDKIQTAVRLNQMNPNGITQSYKREFDIVQSEQISIGKVKEEKGGTPFNVYVEGWIKKYKEPYAKITYIKSIRSALTPALNKFEGKPIEQITGDEIQDLLIHIEAPRMRDLCKLYLSQVFKKANAQRIISDNLLEIVEIKKYRSKHKKGLTITEQEKFLNALDNSPYSLLLRLMLATGLRIGEALALTKSDVDFENCKLTVNKDVIFDKGERIVQDTPKTEAGNRTIPIPKEICRELKKIKTEILFPCTYNAAKKALEKIAKGLDIKMTLHTLRHTYATRLEEAGIPPKLKQYLLGHASLEMTQNTYTDTQMHYVDSMSDKVRIVFERDSKKSRPNDI